MDFPRDLKVRNNADVFMWGDAFLVTPMFNGTTPGTKNTTRTAYLPPSAAWVNFHSGKPQASGEVSVTFALSEAPIFVRAGSIVPMGPFLQHTDEKPADPMEIRVYGGADASFTLFEDDGISTAYRRGQASTIKFLWDDAKRELTIGARQGSSPPELEVRTFSVVC